MTGYRLLWVLALVFCVGVIGACGSDEPATTDGCGGDVKVDKDAMKTKADDTTTDADAMKTKAGDTDVEFACAACGKSTTLGEGVQPPS